MPPLPKVMPTDPVELKILEEGTKRAEARLQAPTPNIWMSISSDVSGDIGFGESVKEYVEEVQSGRYEKFINGKKI
jgi:pantoate kinase